MDENDPELHPFETSTHLSPVGGAYGSLMTGIINWVVL
jgi:hypothetical protein